MPSLPSGLLLVAVLLGSTGATQDAEEWQKENVAVNVLPKRLRPDVADGTPEKPQNFLVISQSSDSIMEMWDKPADGDDVHYFVYVENEDMNDTTSLFYYTWEGLEACTSYTLGVRAVTSKGDMSEPALQEGQTLVGIPPEPQDLHVEKYTHTTVTLAWKEPDTLCHIEHYRVKYKYEGSMPQDIQVFETTVEVSDLLPNTMYTFSIYAFTTEGEGLAATMEQTTALDHPGPPENLVAEGISSTAIKVSWSAPTATPLYYIVTSVPCMYDGKVVYDLTYLIEGLKPCQLCYITVNSYYEDDDSKFPARTSATPSIEAPPPINCVVEVKEQYITVSWEKPSTPCVLGTYNVNWTWKQLWGNVLPKELRCPDPDPEVQVCWEPFSTTCPVSQYNLKWEGDVLWSDTADSNTTTLEWSEDEICYNISSTPYTNYSVELSVGTKLDQTIQCSSTTPMAAPGPPTLEELQTDNLSIKVNWREPEEKNGVIINYLVEWTDWNGVDSFKSTDGNTFSSQIIELSCGGKVDVTVRAKTVEFGEKSLTQSVFIVNSISNLKCEPKKSGVIALSWDVNDSDCLIHRYNVTWNFESLWSDDKGSGWQSVDGNELSALLELLPPYSTVSVEVHVDKSAEETSCFATTLQEAPGPPSLEELQYENFAITVTWKEPEEKNGVITAYEVEWMEANGEEKTHETNGNTFSYQILDPSCGGEVVVTVRAKTVYFGKKSPPRSVVLVNSIMILTCESTDPGVIALDWEIQDKQCPIDSYNVTWSFESLWSDDKGSNWTSIDGNESSVRLTSLPAYSSVSVEFFYSYTQENARCTSITHEETSSIPTLLQQVAKDIYTVSVEWSSPEYLRGKLVGWYLNWTSAIGHYVGEYVIGNPKDLTFEIGSLEPSEVYFVYVMAVNGAGRGEAAVVEASTEYVP